MGPIKESCLICSERKWNEVGPHQEFSSRYILECESCGFMTTLPLLTEDNLSAYYKSRYRSEEKKISLYYRCSQRQRARSQFLFIIRYIHSSLRGSRIMEVGAGIGSLLACFKKIGAEVIGFEPREELAAFARQHNKIDLYGSVFDYKTVSKQRFDLILLSHVLEHIVNPREFLLNLGSLLEKDGSLFIEVPNDNKVKISNRINYKQKTDSHLHFFNILTLSELMKFCGFETAILSTVGVSSEVMKKKSSSKEVEEKSNLNNLIRRIDTRTEDRRGIQSVGLVTLRKVVASLALGKAIVSLYLNNPNSKYYAIDSNDEGNWIRGVFKLQKQ